MAAAGDLIDFEVIESQKENIQSLPSGRSAKALAQIYSPPLASTTNPSLDDANIKARAAFERELLQIDEADDPLDIYDRYVKWTIDAYPSVQATSQSQLLPLLERATKAFQQSSEYKNDSRYLKLWLQYIRLFSDAPREAFIFLARNDIGEALALYYEEYAAWLENAGRWNQAQEIYQLGLERNARPVERLTRKFNEFERRKAAQPDRAVEPASPALPVARPALSAKIDPFATATVQQQGMVATKKPKGNKMQIFSDSVSVETSRPSSTGSNQWENIGTVAERRKENHMVARPMAGETLKTGKTNGGMQKMMIFKDTLTKRSLPQHMIDPKRKSNHAKQCVVNPNSGRLECVAVNLEAVYPGSKRPELSFEELRAQHRGWRPGMYPKQPAKKQPVHSNNNMVPQQKQRGFKIFEDSEQHVAETTLATTLAETLTLGQENDENAPPGTTQKVSVAKVRREERSNRTRKIEIPDTAHVKNETKTVQLNLQSPQGAKPKRKRSIAREATVTINTKEAMDEIYGIFSQPLPSQSTSVDIDDASSVDDCTTDGESTTGTGKMTAPGSEYGDETRKELFGAQDELLNDNTAWSDFKRDDPAELPGYGEDEDLISPLEENFKTQLVPLQNEDHETPSAYPHRYGAIPNHRLPFMTPIAEATESSLGTLTAHRQRELLTTKTPSRQTGSLSAISDDEEELVSSPFQEITELDDVKKRVLQPIRTKTTKGTISLGQGTAKSQSLAQLEGVVSQEGPLKGPIITDLQCNPMDPDLRDNILARIRPGIATFDGYHKHNFDAARSAEIRRWVKSVAKSTRNSGPPDQAPVFQPEGSSTTYTFRKELGAGTFAPVYLVENSAAIADEQAQGASPMAGRLQLRRPLEAIKMEDPVSVWEFYMLNQAHRRLGVSRASESIIKAHEMHVYNDECYLIEEYRDQGTLLDLVNTCRSDNVNAAAGNDEMLAMWLTVELLRTVEALHAKHIIHGDLKGDNMMVRLDDPGVETDWSSTYFASGAHGWSSKGISLIDFGRGIDMKHFSPNVGFVADWKTTETDCAEMRELRPWTYQIDYHGLAGTIHSLLFGKYIETIGERGSGLPGQGATKTYRIRENFKRYWQIDIWNEVFQLLLNPLAHLDAEDGQKLPVLRGMKECREKMESWLEENCEKGVGLKNMIMKIESVIRDKKRKSRTVA